MGSEHGSGSSKHSQQLVDVTVTEDDLLDLEKMSNSDMESGNDGASSKHSQTPAEVTVIEDDLLGLGNKSDPSSPSSSSSDSSFDEDFFLMDENDPRKSDVGATGLGDPFHDLSYSNPVSPRPTSLPDTPVLSPESSSPSKSPKQSPPIQMMERFEVPDPNRIPSAVFARTKSTAPVEWSMQSNESLFSIHMGNNSFSRDQIFLMGRSQELGLGGLGKSQELGKQSEDMFKFPNNASAEVNNFPASAVAISDKKSSGMGVAEAAAETMKEVIRESAKDSNKPRLSAEAIRRSASISHRSDGSVGSTVSFAFPILTKDGTKNGSVKPETEKEKKKQEQQQSQSQSQPDQPAANANGNSWLSCFTCSFCR